MTPEQLAKEIERLRRLADTHELHKHRALAAIESLIDLVAMQQELANTLPRLLGDLVTYRDDFDEVANAHSECNNILAKMQQQSTPIAALARKETP